MGYPCAAEDGHEAVLLATNLSNGDTLAWCPEHLSTFAVSLLEDTGIQVGSDPADFLAKVKMVAVQQLGAIGGMTASKPVKAARVEQVHAFADAVAALYANEPGFDGDRTIAQVIEDKAREDEDDDPDGVNGKPGTPPAEPELAADGLPVNPDW